MLIILLPSRRRPTILLAAALAILTTAGATGCNSSTSTTTSTGSVATNPYAGTYDVTITATYYNGKTTTHTTVIGYNID
jgi:hypothetical protein